MYDIECYNESEFKTIYTTIYTEFSKQAKLAGVDLTKYYFGQYMKFGENEEVTYNNLNNENITFDVQWNKGILEDVSVSMD